jgi:hypothetical protein
MGGYLTVLGIVAVVVSSRVAYRMDMNWFVFMWGIFIFGFWAYILAFGNLFS